MLGIEGVMSFGRGWTTEEATTSCMLCCGTVSVLIVSSVAAGTGVSSVRLLSLEFVVLFIVSVLEIVLLLEIGILASFFATAEFG